MCRSALGHSILREIEVFKLDVAKEDLIQNAMELDIAHFETLTKHKGISPYTYIYIIYYDVIMRMCCRGRDCEGEA